MGHIHLRGKWRPRTPRWYNAALTHIFPNVLQVLKLLLVTPVTTASVERANSALGFVKSDHRSTMSEGSLNALLRLYVHKDTQLDFEEVVTAVVTPGFGPSRGKLCLVVICQPGTLINSTGHSQKRLPGRCIQSFEPHHPPNTPMLYPNISFADPPPPRNELFLNKIKK